MGTAWPTGDADLPPDDAKDLFDPVEPLLKPADVTFGNLETVLADEGESHKCHSRSSHCFAFRAPTTYARSLANAGFNLMSIANNHAGDFGPSGRESTMAALDGAGVHHSGPTGDVASWELEGRRIALIAFSFGSDGYRIQEIDSGRRLVAGLAKEHDLVIVSFHAGAEGSGAQHVPKGVERFLGENRGDSRAFAHAMVDAGASLLLGSGPHVLRGVEIYRRRLIAYSLGNFSAWRTFSLSGSTAISAVLRATLAPDGAVTSIRIEPLVIDPPGRPRPDADRRAIDLIRRLSRADFGSPVLDESGEWQMTPSAP
jgi:poly-gamma-glutamate capsule biosynthesis protein CapA/YwtB (metallophosphatase superfamily)